MFARLPKPDEPFDLSLFGWISDTPDPSQFVVACSASMHSTARFLDARRSGAGCAPLSNSPAPQRIEAYVALDRDLAAQEAPVRGAMSAERTDFFSARIGCQVEHPLYGIDLGGCACATERRGYARD